MIKKDKLDLMFMLQTRLQQRIYKDKLPLININQEYIEKMFIGVVTELCESLENTPWKKQWKPSANLDNDKFRKEIIDLWNFVINYTLASGMTAEDVYHMFTEKNKENKRRQSNGY